MHQEQTKERVIQEYVPGKQITLLHLIANPNGQIHKKLGLEGDSSAIGIITITPGEASIIASDVATKSGAIEIGFLDRFTGAVVIRGDVSAIEHALNQVKYVMGQMMQFSACEMTRT